MKLATVYALLALLATICNIGTQDLFLLLYHGPYDILLSVLVGTGAGLIVKYALDKRYIFRFKADNMAHDGQVFLLYSLMGVLTTFIFWGFEFTFHVLFQTDLLRYTGGVIGLVIGYVAKYELDRRFVFRKDATA